MGREQRKGAQAEKRLVMAAQFQYKQSSPVGA